MPEAILQEPVIIFMTIMAVILVAPLLSKRINLPGIVGLILGGMLVGSHGLNLLSMSETMELFGAVGLIYLMFDAGLEIDLTQLNRFRVQAVVFAVISYLLPQLSGIALGRAFGLGWMAAALLGATYASQTLIAYPVLRKLGIIRNRAMAITIGATIFTDILALLVLGVATGTQDGSFSFLILARLIGFAVVFALVILLAVPRLGKLFFRFVEGDAVEFQFVLLVLFVAAVGAELIGMHTIVGAFLAGLAVNATLSKHSKVISHVHFMGDSFFVPLFLLTVGMRLDPVAVVTDLRTLLIGISLTAAVYITKGAAAWITGRIYDFSLPEILTTWGLSQAQAAATLAAVLVGTEAGLFSQAFFNGAILTVLFTTLTSPIIVRKFGKQLRPDEEQARQSKPAFARMLVPILSDRVPRYLMNLGALLVHAEEGTLLSLVIEENENKVKNRVELVRKEGFNYPDTQSELLQRINPDPYQSILKAAGEADATMIVLNWTEEDSSGRRVILPGVAEVLEQAKIPVLAGSLTMSTDAHRRIVLGVASNTIGVKLNREAVAAVKSLAETTDLPLVILATSHYHQELEDGFQDEEQEIEVIRLGEDPVNEILEHLEEHDHLILTTMSSQKRIDGEADSLPNQLREQFQGSMSLLHYP
jgi:Kef-type K+ transport system membrane component KefB